MLLLEKELLLKHWSRSRDIIYHLLKVHSWSYKVISKFLDLGLNDVQTQAGFKLMEFCRKDQSCPYKALLPENSIR